MSAEGDLQLKKKKKSTEDPVPKTDEKQKDKFKVKKKNDKKKTKKQTFEDLAEEYNLTADKKSKLYIPEYFTRKERYADLTEEKVAIFQAKNFLLGMDIFAEQGSCSVKLTYIGPNRRYTFQSILIGKRVPAPTKNNWKIWPAPMRLVRGEEAPYKVKDHNLIRDLSISRGGKKNFRIRFVSDKDFQIKEVKKKMYTKDLNRDRNRSFRIKKDQSKLGIKVVFRNKAEAKQLLKELSQEMKHTEINKDIIPYIQSEIKRFETIEKEQEKQRKKD